LATIPFCRADLGERELEAVRRALDSHHLSGDGAFGRKAEAILVEATGVKRAMLTTSCTHALEMSAILLDIGPGDEVIVPSFTFVSTVNAFVLRGATPVFADIRPDTLNLDETQLSSLVTQRTKAIVPVHYAGVACEMDAILSHGIPVVEDNAHGLFGSYKGRPLGTFGVLATQSFHETKNFTCGEGGALLVNDARLIERAEILREKGTNRSNFFRGLVDKYTWVDLGSSWVLSDILGAMLVAQLERRAEIQSRRRALFHRYATELADWAASHEARLPIVPAHCEQAFHMFYLLMPTLERRTALIDHLRAEGIQAVFHYVPLHSSPMGKKFGGRECLVTESVSDRIVRLPFHTCLTDDDQSRVIDAVRSVS
jgi:dTDP-4-amino-4,6-dideoxygalactose transaminase